MRPLESSEKTQSIKRRKAIVGAISGSLSGGVMGIATAYIIHVTDPMYAVSYFSAISWTLLWIIVGALFGLLFGIFARPTYNALPGGCMGSVVGLLIGGIVAVIRLPFDTTPGGTLELLSWVFDSAIIGFTIGAIVGGLVYFIGMLEARKQTSS